VGLEDLRQTLATQNVNLPSGSLYGVSKAFSVQSTSQLNTAPEFRPLIISYRNGNPVRLEDVANVLDSVTLEKSVFWVNGIPQWFWQFRSSRHEHSGGGRWNQSATGKS